MKLKSEFTFSTAVNLFMTELTITYAY